MPKKLLDADLLPMTAAERLNTWGRCIKTQRLQQRIRTADLCNRIDISLATLRRLERGDPGTSVGAYLSALVVLGVIDDVAPALPLSLFDVPGSRRVKLTDAESGKNLDYF